MCLLTALADLINVALKGEVPEYGGNLCALTKRADGIRSIAVGCSTYRRLATKVGTRPLSALGGGGGLCPAQLGFSTTGGCAVAVHATRRFLYDSERRRVLLKIDMRSTFNSLRRDTFLRVARVHSQGLYSLLWQAYSNSSVLFFGEDVLQSEEGIQQGDPFGPALFVLGLDDLTREVESGFNVWYLNDATLGGSPDVVLRDVRLLVTALGAIGLEVNRAKCDLTVLGHADVDPVLMQFREVIPDVRLVELDRLVLLSAPVVGSAILPILAKKMGVWSVLFRGCWWFVLLENAFSIPKLLYILRASPAYQHQGFGRQGGLAMLHFPRFSLHCIRRGIWCRLFFLILTWLNPEILLLPRRATWADGPVL